eukprot:CAMPEP_0172493168 /NCGR_PEP_ID=MMETSP1066-20121228/24531_1 /TAXON_ID=671091 /ORGANISM="Coscinodiscus wailesii, Strain CCMP2513" /LENGTH=64 /DNA_ID=CAMNT_0013263191 /DNA_START=57 /DNA_END=247 /DNA_ORIENTATION=-
MSRHDSNSVAISPSSSATNNVSLPSVVDIATSFTPRVAATPQRFSRQTSSSSSHLLFFFRNDNS